MSPRTRSLPLITLATRVTLLRLAGIPLFAGLLLRFFATGDPEWRRWALKLFVLIIATDALDGWLARSHKEESPLGAFLDPLADKFLMLCAIALLTRPYDPTFAPQFPLALALLILGREVFLFAGYWVIRRRVGRVTLRPRPSGKAATFLVAALVVALLWPFSPNAILLLALLTALCFALSWLQYLQDGLAQLRSSGTSAPPGN